MAKEYFLARDEMGLHLFGSKPYLRRTPANYIHWEWVDGEGRHGWPIVEREYPNNIRPVQFNSYIKLIDFEEDGLFSPLRDIEYENFINEKY